MNILKASTRSASGPQPSSAAAATWLVRAAVAIAVVSVLCLAAILVGYALQLELWPGLFFLGLYGLPAAFAFLVVSLLIQAFRNRRSA